MPVAYVRQFGVRGNGSMATSKYFLTAYQRAVASEGGAAWSMLTIPDQAGAIYREFRAMDAEQLSKQGDTLRDFR
jgi:hypothetical protein